MKYRKLRIAWSVACGIACVLLIVMWVWSWFTPGRVVIMRTPIGTVCFYSAAGQLVTIATFTVVEAKHLEMRPNGAGTRIIDPPLDFTIYPDSFGARHLTNASCLQMPYWFLFPAFVALCICPWLRWQFSLRTMLIATTLVAVAVLLLVWAAK